MPNLSCGIMPNLSCGVRGLGAALGSPTFDPGMRSRHATGHLPSKLDRTVALRARLPSRIPKHGRLLLCARIRVTLVARAVLRFHMRLLRLPRRLAATMGTRRGAQQLRAVQRRAACGRGRQQRMVSVWHSRRDLHA